jgi:hypothetical protein
MGSPLVLAPGKDDSADRIEVARMATAARFLCDEAHILQKSRRWVIQTV